MKQVKEMQIAVLLGRLVYTMNHSNAKEKQYDNIFQFWKIKQIMSFLFKSLLRLKLFNQSGILMEEICLNSIEYENDLVYKITIMMSTYIQQIHITGQTNAYIPLMYSTFYIACL